MYIDEIHCYLDATGKPIPSVSQIVKAFIPMNDNIPLEVLKNAGERGSRIHKATELIDKGEEYDNSEDIEPYLNAYISAREDLPDWETTEAKFFYEHFAGTTDRTTEDCVYDIKTQSAKDIKKWTLQLSLYCLALGKPKAKIIWLRKTGKYQIIDIEVDFALATSCVWLFKFLHLEKWEKEMTELVYNHYNNFY